jgi:hypothetical protein
VAEKDGMTEAAAVYYRQSYELNATAAAKAKMSACPALVEVFTTSVFSDRKAALADIAHKPDFKSWDDYYGTEGDVVVAAHEDEIDRAYAILSVASGVAVVRSDQDVVMGVKGPSASRGAVHEGAEWVVTGQATVPGNAACEPDGPCMITGNVEGGSHDVYYVDAATRVCGTSASTTPSSTKSNFTWRMES